MNPKSKRKVEPDYAFEVTLETTVGFVTFGGDVSPMVAAFQLIADHHERDGEGGVYRFPGPAENSMVRVEVKVEDVR